MIDSSWARKAPTLHWAAKQERISRFEAAQFHLQTVDCIDGNLAIFGKQTQVRMLILLFIKHCQRLAPSRLLLVDDLATADCQKPGIKGMTLALYSGFFSERLDGNTRLTSKIMAKPRNSLQLVKLG